MKLKKFAALALAGVMAVSMLAGCAGKGTDDKTDMSKLGAAVVAALSSDTTKTVTVTSNNELANAVNALKAKYGTSTYKSKVDTTELAKVNTNFSSATATKPKTSISGGQTGIDAAMAKTSYSYVYSNDATVTSKNEIAGLPAGANEATAVKAMAAQVDSAVAYLKNNGYLTAESANYTNVVNGITYTGKITYKYDVAVSACADTDAETGVVVYYLTLTVTRSGSEVKL